MTQTFVRYSPDVEKADPNFQTNLATAIDDMKRFISHSVEVTPGRHATRDAHAQGYGLARGEVEILSGLPAAYAQGIYVRPGRHEAMVRFSNGSHLVASDVVLGNVTGLALKIFGIEGRTLLEDEPDTGTFDYANINYPVFFANTIEHYVFIHELIFGITPPTGKETPESKRAQTVQFVYGFLTGKGKLAPEDWAWEELGAFLSLSQIKSVNLLLSTYWTMGPCATASMWPKSALLPSSEL